MTRMSYKTALRAKGIKPIPGAGKLGFNPKNQKQRTEAIKAAAKLRSSIAIKADTIDATASALAERRAYHG